MTFAVKEEAAAFRAKCEPLPNCEVLITGMGAGNAQSAVEKRLRADPPTLVITSGFAGGLNPMLETGRVVFEADPESHLTPALKNAGACPVRFRCVERVLSAAKEKIALWESSGCDAVEMESGVIRRLCRELGIPAATVRVISDSAAEDLPLDFNRLMRADMSLDYLGLARTLARSPQKIPSLLKFQGRVKDAAQSLAAVLARVIEPRLATEALGNAQ